MGLKLDAPANTMYETINPGHKSRISGAMSEDSPLAVLFFPTKKKNPPGPPSFVAMRVESFATSKLTPLNLHVIIAKKINGDDDTVQNQQ